MKPFALKKSDAKSNLKNYLLVCCLFGPSRPSSMRLSKTLHKIRECCLIEC
jgi:hypothetical protein